MRSVLKALSGALLVLLSILTVPAAAAPSSAFGVNTTVGGTLVSPSLGTAYYDTLAQFQARTAFTAGENYAYVRSITNTWPAPAGQDPTSLLYHRVSSPTGLYGEQTIAGVAWDPVYSTHPVKTSEFGDVGDGSQAITSGYITATSNGTNVLTTSSTANVTVGANIGSISWHSRQTAGLPIVPPGTTVVSFVANTSITLSQAVPAGTNLSLFVEKITTSGTDDTNTIQKAIDFALQNNYPDVQIANGRHKTSDVINAGWGETFHELDLTGSNRPAFEGGPAGVVLLPTKTDRPALNFQGMRNGKCDGIAIVGLNNTWTSYTQIFSYAITADPLDWTDPAYYVSSGSGALQTNASYAGITVDAYSGSAPANAYPARTFPSWTGLTAQYGGAFSSNIDAGGCEVEGFAVDYAIGLNTNSQGDFMTLPRTGGAAAIFAIIGNSQARNNDFENASLSGVNTVITNYKYANGTGGASFGHFNNISMGETYQLADIQLPNSGSVEFDNIYCEVCVKIGNFIDGTGRSSSVVFNNPEYSFGSTLTGQIPAALFSGAGRIIVNNFNFTEITRMTAWSSGSSFLTINGGTNSVAQPHVASVSAPEQQAVGYTGGMLVGFPAANTNQYNHFLIQTPYMGTTYIGGSAGEREFSDTIQFSAINVPKMNRSPMTQGATKYVDDQGEQYHMAVPYPALIGLSVSTGSYDQVPAAISYANDVATFSYCSYWQSQNLGIYNMAPGDILYVVNTSTIFVIESVSAPVTNSLCSPTATSVTVTAKQQNNITIGNNPALGNFEQWTGNTNPDPTLGGYTFLIKTGAVIPSELFRGTFATNCAITGASRGDGYGGNAANYYALGDPMYGLPFGNPINPWPVNGNGIVTLGAVTAGTPASIAAGTGTCTAGTFPIFPYPLH